MTLSQYTSTSSSVIVSALRMFHYGAMDSSTCRKLEGNPFLTVDISRDRTGSAAVSEIISAEDIAVTVVAACINAPMVTTSSMSLSVSSPFGEGWCDSASAAN